VPPEWISSYGDYLNYVLNAHSEAINANSVGAGGKDIHVAILDSMLEYPNDPDNAEIGERRSFIGSDEKYTTPHGCWVFDEIAYFAPNAKYSFFQGIDDNGKLGIGPFSKSITAAIESDVDIINLSAGVNWGGPPEDNPYSREIQRAVDAGIIVVAAAGNYTFDGPRPEVFHPARRDDVIAVGGFVTTCPSDHTETHNVPNQGPFYDEDQIDEEADPGVPKEVYCGYEGCVESQGCLSRQTIKPWPGNPKEEARKIDVLAPAYTAASESDLIAGSSHAAPIVTGVLAESFGNLIREGHEIPSIEAVLDAIRDTSVPLDNGDGRRLHAIRLYNQLTESSPQSETGSVAD